MKKRRKKRKKEEERFSVRLLRQRVPLVTLSALLVGGALIGVSYWYSSSQIGSSSSSGRGISSSSTILTGTTEQPTKGYPDAPVTIVEFSEFYCPFCARFAWETKPRIEKDYIAKGLVKFVYRNLVVHGPPALLAAVAGECAHEQGKFWDYHDRLFEAVFPGKSISRHQELEVADLKGLASEVGLDPEEFNACLEGYDIRFNSCFFDYNSCVTAGRDQEECETEFNDCLAADVMFQKVLEDQEELWRLIAQLPPEEQAKAQRLGTPTFFINGHILIGAQPYENFKRLIDRELAEAQGG